MRAALWVTAFLLFAISLAIVSYLLKDKVRVLFPGELNFSDVVNIALFVVAIFALFIALASYSHSIETAKQQRETLEASRKALEAVVSMANKQQALLEKNLQTSEAQLSVIQEQWRRELERQARKPEVEIGLDNISWEELQRKPTIDLPAGLTNWKRLIFRVRNTGNAPVLRPVVIIAAIPETVFVDLADFRMAERANHNRYQFSGPTVNDIQPFAQTNTDYTFRVDVTVPPGIKEFAIVFRIFGQNLETKEIKTHFRVIPPNK